MTSSLGLGLISPWPLGAGQRCLALGRKFGAEGQKSGAGAEVWFWGGSLALGGMDDNMLNSRITNITLSQSNWITRYTEHEHNVQQLRPFAQ